MRRPSRTQFEFRGRLLSVSQGDRQVYAVYSNLFRLSIVTCAQRRVENSNLFQIVHGVATVSGRLKKSMPVSVKGETANTPTNSAQRTDRACGTHTEH